MTATAIPSSRRCRSSSGLVPAAACSGWARAILSSANELDQDIIEITDDFTMQLGSHTVTLGTHNEFFDFRNLFIQNSFGYYTFTSVENFEAGLRAGICVFLLEHRRSAAGR